ncbi:MAG TPA: tripartite tricarboxylate transporter substrate binding protein [Burkholderiales bacterium]
MKHIPWSRAALAAGMLALFAAQANGQSVYPNKPIHLIVGLAPGGIADQAARLIAPEITKALNVQVLVENRTGANGNIGARAVADSAPDGYTLMLAFDGTMVAGAAYNPQTPFDPVRDFVPVTKLADSPVMITAHPSLPANNIRELVDLARAHPGRYDFGTAGNGSTGHLTGELIKNLTGANIVHVPYRGGGDALRDVLAGQIHLMFAAVAASAAQVKGGRLKGIAVTSPKRIEALPEVPTVAESGVTGLKDFNVQSWVGIMAPLNTPRPVVETLNHALVASLATSDVRARFVAIGAEAAGNRPDEFGAQVAADLTRWKRLITSAKLAAN